MSISKKKNLAIGLCFLFLFEGKTVFADKGVKDAEPFQSMSLCLVMNNWTYWGIWQFEVNALAGDRILIGERENHFHIGAGEPGYSHVIDGKIVANYPDASSLAELGTHCGANCPANYQARVDWFKRRCQKY